MISTSARRGGAGLILAWIVTLIGPDPGFGQAADPWIGRRVITRYGTVLKVGKQVVDDEGRSRNLAVSCHESSVFRVYRVEHVNGPWLWLQAEKEGACGWAKVGDVIPYEQAIDYITAEIRSNPSSAYYNDRGNVWGEKGEYDIAIADYNEAIRLDPKDAWGYNGRAWLWATCTDEVGVHGPLLLPERDDSRTAA